ncbi:MAG: putative phosphoglycerate mutase family protein [Firmicutes bacterium]|nr:putative phosphoglycerate mutase family protein [Bacillota bacterium]
MTTIYMVRHGETDLNKQKVYFGWSDVPLNVAGEGQCQALREKLDGIHFDAVITSPLKRTLRSAKIIHEKLENLIICEELKELNFGQWEGLHYTVIEKNYKEEWAGWSADWVNFCIPQGESFALLYQRVKACFLKLLDRYRNQTILLVGHAGVLKIISLLIMDLPLDEYWNISFEFGTYKVFAV